MESNTTISIFSSYAELQFISALLFIVAIVGFSGNVLVIIAVLTVKKLQTKTNVFVLNLAVADVVACTVMPLQSVTYLQDEFIFPLWLAKVNAFCLLACIGCSINCLACIAVNRLIGITTAPNSVYRKLFTPCKLSLLIVLTWLPPLVVATIPLVSDYADYGYNPIYKSMTWESNTSYTFTFATLVGAVFTPIQFIVLFVSYLKIFLFVRKTSRAMLKRDGTVTSSMTLQRQLWERQVAVTKNLFIVVCVFLICLCPYFACLSLSDTFSSSLSYAAVVLVSNSSVNPIIYATRDQNFRAAFVGILRCDRKRLITQSRSTRRVCPNTTTQTDNELKTSP